MLVIDSEDEPSAMTGEQDTGLASLSDHLIAVKLRKNLNVSTFFLFLQDIQLPPQLPSLNQWIRCFKTIEFH